LFEDSKYFWQDSGMVDRVATSIAVLTVWFSGWGCQLTASEPTASPFEKEIRAFEAADRTNPPPTEAVLFVGSSSIRFWTNLSESFPQMTTIRRGFGGSTFPDLLYYCDRVVLPYRPAKIVVYEGDNDIARGDSPEQVFAGFREFVTKVRAAQPGARIYFLAIKPSPSRWHLSPQQREANRLIERYCARHKNLKFVNIWPATLNGEGKPDPKFYKADQLHLNNDGYSRWVPIISRALND
jgi:lysophospholipase L1-like esterase